MRSKLEYQTLQSQIDELAGKITVRQRDNESALRAQHGAIEKNEGKIIHSNHFVGLLFSHNRKSTGKS